MECVTILAEDKKTQKGIQKRRKKTYRRKIQERVEGIIIISYIV